MSVLEITETLASARYWQALREGRLDFQQCDECGHAWLPPGNHCPACLATKLSWRSASGRGHLVSWVVYHKAYATHLKDQVPYNVAIVQLAEGPRLLTNIVGRPDGNGLAIGKEVQLCIEESDGRALARFRLAEDATRIDAG